MAKMQNKFGFRKFTSALSYLVETGRGDLSGAHVPIRSCSQAIARALGPPKLFEGGADGCTKTIAGEYLA